MKICENCEKEHNGSYASGRFCSMKCSRSFSTKANRKEISAKVSKAMSVSRGGVPKKWFELECSVCGKDFRRFIEITVNFNNRQHCSKSCVMKDRDSSVRSKAATKGAASRNANGTQQGFKFRRGKYATPSWAESYFMQGLDARNISYEREYKIDKYFADFAFLEKKIVLEVDGKQHLYPERIEHDKIRDFKMESLGWKVHRIAWIKAGDPEMIKNFEEFCKNFTFE